MPTPPAAPASCPSRSWREPGSAGGTLRGWHNGVTVPLGTGSAHAPAPLGAKNTQRGCKLRCPPPGSPVLICTRTPERGDAPGSGAGGNWVPWGAAAPHSPQLHQPLRAVSPRPRHPTGAGKHKRAWGGHPHLPPSPPPGNVALVAPGGCCALTLGSHWGQGPAAHSQGRGGSVSPRVALLHACSGPGSLQVPLAPCHSRRHVDVPVPLLPARDGHCAACSLLGWWLRTRGGDTAATPGSLS